MRALLARAAWSVSALVRPSSQDRLPEHPRLSPVIGDLQHGNALCELVAGADVVIHLAGAIRGRSERDFMAANRDGTLRLLDALASTNPDAHLINISSLAARAPDISWYAASKAAGEQAVAERATNWTSLRPPVVYGPDDPALAPLWRSLARGWLPVMGSVDNRFSVVHADDLVGAILCLAEGGRSLNASVTLHDGEAEGYTWRRLARLAETIRGRPVRTVVVPAPLLAWVARANLMLSRCYRQAPILVPGKARELVHSDWFCDNAALHNSTGWTPVIRLSHALNSLPGWNQRS